MPHEIEGGRATGSIKEGLSKSWQGKLQLGVVCQLPTSHVDHAGPCRTMQDHAGLCRTMQDYAGLCRTMQDYAGTGARRPKTKTFTSSSISFVKLLD